MEKTADTKTADEILQYAQKRQTEIAVARHSAKISYVMRVIEETATKDGNTFVSIEAEDIPDIKNLSPEDRKEAIKELAQYFVAHGYKIELVYFAYFTSVAIKRIIIDFAGQSRVNCRYESYF